MGTDIDHVTLYSPQSDIVWQTVRNDGIAYSRRDYVQNKYGESAGIFLTAYDAYIGEAEKIVPRPESWVYPYWAFASVSMADTSGGSRVMELSVPADEAVFFDAYDWYKVLRLSYIGESEADEAAFSRKLQMRGIRDSSDAVLKPFYPDIKREIVGSWKRLFRHDEEIRRNISGCNKDAEITACVIEACGVRAIQAGLWQIKKEWLK